MTNEKEELGSQVKELPPDIVAEVGIRLRHEDDLKSFRSTCKLWRTLVPSPFSSIFPLKIPTPPLYNELRSHKPCTRYYITQHTGYLLSGTDNKSTKFCSWFKFLSKFLSKMNISKMFNTTEFRLWLESEISNTGNNTEFESEFEPFFLVLETKPQGNGFFPSRLFTIMSSEEDWSPPLQLDLQRHQKSVLYESYYLQLSEDSHPPNCGVGDSGHLQKLVLFSYYTDNRSTTSTCDRIPRFAVMETGVGLAAVAVLKNGDLAHLTINNNNINNSSLMEWKLVEVDRESTKFDDIIYYDGRLWGVDLFGGAFVMNDYKFFDMTQIAASPIMGPLSPPLYSLHQSSNNHKYYDEGGIQGRKRLVEDSGTLYMLFPCPRPNHNKSNQINVYKLVISEEGFKDDNQYKYEWVEIESIGNKAFFVGLGFSFSMEIGPGTSTGVCFRENPRAKNGNCIFLSGLSFCRSDLAKNDFPLFEQMIKCEYSTTGVYSLVDKEFSTISALDSPSIFCYPYIPHPSSEEADKLLFKFFQRQRLRQRQQQT